MCRKKIFFASNTLTKIFEDIVMPIMVLLLSASKLKLYSKRESIWGEKKKSGWYLEPWLKKSFHITKP